MNNPQWELHRLPIESITKLALLVVGGIGIFALVSKIAGRSIDESQKKKAPRKPTPNRQPNIPKPGASQSGGRRGPNEDQEGGPQKVNLQQLLMLAEKAAKSGDYDRAEQYYLLALETLEKMNADLFSVGIITYAVGLNYRKKHELEFAEEYISKAITIFNEIISNPETLETSLASQILDQYADMLATISEVYSDLEKYDEAEENLMKCFKFLEKKAEVIENTEVHSPEEERAKADEKKKTNKQLGVLYDNLASLRMRQKRLDEAEEVAKKAINILKESFGPMEVITVQAMMKLATLFREKNKMSEENGVYESILQEIEAESGKTSPRTASFLQFIGHQNMRKDGLTYAEGCLQKALEIYQNLADNEIDGEKKTNNELEILNDLVNVFLNQENEPNSFQTRQMTKQLLKKAKRAPLITTEYFKTARASFKYDAADSLADLKTYYYVILERTETKLTEDTFMVCTFENPVEGEPAIVVEQQLAPDQTTVILKSPELPKTEMKVYEATVVLYKSSTKQEKLSSHHLFIKGTIDTSELKDMDDLQMKLYETTSLH